MAHGRDAADGLAGGGPDEVGVRPPDRGEPAGGGDPGGVDPVGSASHDQQRRPVGAEDQAVRDRPDLAAASPCPSPLAERKAVRGRRNDSAVPSLLFVREF